MLNTNLSTRPFYNERAVHWVLALACAAIVALTVYNVTRVISLTSRQAGLSAEVGREEQRIQELAAQAARVRGSIDQNALARVVAAAKEANGIIEQRTFSWTELFNHLEATLPPGVMLTSVVPRIQPDHSIVNLVVLGKEVEQIDEFIEKLEATGVFSRILVGQESVNEDEQIQATLTARYKPTSRAPDAQKSGAQKSDTQKPDTQKPDAQKPETQKPAAPKQEARNARPTERGGV